MLYKPVVILHVVKDLLKSYTVVKNKVPQLQKWVWQIIYKNARFQVSVRSYCTIKSKQTKNNNK